jgi:hypothetical protein
MKNEGHMHITHLVPLGCHENREGQRWDPFLIVEVALEWHHRTFESDYLSFFALVISRP